MIAALAPYKMLAEFLLLAALAWGGHLFLEHERDIGRAEVRALWDAQKLSDKTASDKQEKEWREKYDVAINQGAENVKVARAAAVSANTAADSLRNTSTSILKLIPNASTDTARAYATAYAAVFAECSERYKAMGELAQGHFNDDQAVRLAWPTAPVSPK